MGDLAVVTVSFNCDVQYLGHDPGTAVINLRIRSSRPQFVRALSPLAAHTQERFRPASADLASLVDVEYDGESSVGYVSAS